MRAGDVVIVDYPFSDLSGSKLRPALITASAGRNELIACQITGQDWDGQAIAISDDDFASGGLRRPSRIRPAKLFTADRTLIKRRVGRLKGEVLERVKQAVIDVIQNG